MNKHVKLDQQELETRPLTEREILTRDSFTPAEISVFVMILMAFIASILAAEPRNLWSIGIYIILAPLSIATVKLHEIVHPFKIENLWRSYALLLLPAPCIILQFTIGLIFPTIESLQIEQEVYYVLTDTSQWLPATALSEAIKTTITFFGFISIFVICLNLYIIPKSLIFFKNLLSKLCLLAAFSAVVGFIYKALGNRLFFFSNGTEQSNFFAFFPYDGHWAAFACLWCGVSFAFSIEYLRGDDPTDFLQSKGPWYLASAIILGFSGIFVKASGASAVLLLFLSWILLMLALELTRFTKDRHQKSLSMLSTLGSCCLFAVAIFRFTSPSPNTEEVAMLRESSFRLFLERPLFGWGFESFPRVSAFFNNDALLGTLNLSPHSDILNYLSEIGLFGCLIIIAYLITLILRYWYRKKASCFCNNMLLAIAAVLIIACIDNPFMSPTVTLSFFIIFFSALRFAAIEQNKSDQVDIEMPRLVSPASERKVPFFTGQQNNKEI
ncbi:MAG: Uncharacterised protein [Opitutia bacterium UBA7350]|nr:MAG: Uncharacterised protein [Opitutae bacterium UBA7350]